MTHIPSKHTSKGFVIPSAVAIILSSCSDRNNAPQDKPIEILVDLNQTEHISTDLGNLVQLETTDSSVIYDICALVPTSDNWIVQSRSFVRVFDKQSGRFLNNISRVGQGPGEYLSIQQFWNEGDTLHLLDFNLGCVLDYTTEGNFLDKSINFLNINAENFNRGNYVTASPDGQNYYVINCYTGIPDRKDPQYFIISKTGEFIKHVPGRELSDASFTPDRMYTDFEHQRVLAWEQLRDTLFTVDSEGVHPIYTFNFGNNRFPLTSQSKPELTKRLQDFLDNESSISYASFIKYYQTIGDNLFFSFGTSAKDDEQNCYLGVYNEKNGKIRTFTFESEDGRYEQAMFYKIDGDNLLIAMVDKENVEANPLILDISIASFLK